MRRFIVASCCTIVGLQLLVGVPVVLCLTLVSRLQSSRPEPTADFRVASDAQPATPRAASAEPGESTAQHDSILEARAGRGSLLAGTLFEAGPSVEEQSEFVAAIRQAAAEDIEAVPAFAPANLLRGPVCEAAFSDPDLLRASADRFAIEHLYLIAEQDEQAGLFERSDQWRGQARAIRRSLNAANNGDSTAGEPCCGDPICQ
jgi:hypothetical protein